MEETDLLVYQGDEIKALGGKKFGGYLVRFSTENDPDLVGDYFTKETDFDLENGRGTSQTYFNHGMDKKMGRRKLGKATLIVDDVGVWADHILSERDDYEKMVEELAEAGKLGWSSGTASHLVEREASGKANRITRWPLGLDASYTHTPAEPRNVVMSLKSLIQHESAEAGIGAGEAEEIKNKTIRNEDTKMDDKDIANMVAVSVKAALDARDSEIKAEQLKVDALKVAEETGYKKALEDIGGSNRRAYSFHKESELGFAQDADKGFMHWLKTGQKNGALISPDGSWDKTPEVKGAMQGQSAGEGGYLVPDGFLGTIIQKRDHYSWARQIGCTIIPTTLDVLKIPTESTAQTKFTVTAEEGTYSNNEPTIGQVSITVHKMTKEVRVSEELEADEKTNLQGYFSDQFGRAWALADDYYFSTGSGTNEPQGVVTGGTAATAISGSATFTAAEVTAIPYTLHPAYVANASWLMRPVTEGLIRAIQAGASAGIWMFQDWPQGSTGGRPTLMGRPVYHSGNIAVFASGAKIAVFGDFSMYAIVQREGMVVTRNPYLYMASGQIGLFAKVRQGGAVLQAEALSVQVAAT
jgi:HK97 family phage major capsid protein